MIIGITGGTGCGKTTVLRVLQDLGGSVIDCDAVYHALLETDPSLLRAIEARFPSTVENNQLQRKKLGALVFADAQALLDLNAITHSAVKAHVQRLLADAPALVAIDAIALFEGGLAQLCDITIAVTAPEALRVERLMARDGISREYALARIGAQHDNAYFSALCDHTLENCGSQEDFRAKCLAFFQSLDIMKP